jgi:aldose 1-epimerase
VPWSNRIREGKLRWQGRTYQLRVNYPDGTAIHGTGTEYPWQVVEQSADRVVLEFSSRDVYGVNFPWTFSARFTYALVGTRFTCTMALTNTDHETFPAGLGHHPYFMRRLTAADGTAVGEEARLRINCAKGYALINQMPDGPAGDVPAHADYRQMRELGNTFVDDCLTDRTAPISASIDYPGALRIDVEADDLLQHVVVYVPEDKPFFALEPVTNANDAFNLDEAGSDTTGLFLVQPGQTETTQFSFAAHIY